MSDDHRLARFGIMVAAALLVYVVFMATRCELSSHETTLRIMYPSTEGAE